VPRWSGLQFAATPQDLQLADFVNVSDFELGINDSKSNPFDTIANPELLFAVGSGTHGDSKFRLDSIRPSLNA
jgi:hypothetical protein